MPVDYNFNLKLIYLIFSDGTTTKTIRTENTRTKREGKGENDAGITEFEPAAPHACKHRVYNIWK